MKHTRLILASLLLLLVAEVRATVINVPANQPSIQAGINAASNGDTVLVAPGDYLGGGNWMIHPRGKHILIKAGGSPGAVRIFQDTSFMTYDGSVFICDSNETRECVISGFDMNGEQHSPNWPGYRGTGASILNSSPTFENCTFRDYWSQSQAGAVYISGGSPLFRGCTFSSNMGGFSAGLAQSGSNKQPNYIGNGGAVASYGASPVFDSCLFTGNDADGGNGGAIYATGGTVTVTGSTFNSNFSYNELGIGYGGAVYGDGTFIDCAFINSDVIGSGTGRGGAVAGVGQFTRCLFAQNECFGSGRGGAIYGGGTISNCSFYVNTSLEASAIYTTTATTITSSVFNGNVSYADETTPSTIDGASTNLSCSNIFGNTGGDWSGIIAGQADQNDNFSLNPQRCPGAYTIYSTSPCAPENNDCNALIGALGIGCTCCIGADSLAALFPLNGNAADTSGNGHNGTVTGALPSTDRFGAAGSALHFDGVDDSIFVSDHVQLDITAGLTISLWMKLDIGAGQVIPVSKRVRGADSVNYAIMCAPGTPSNAISFQYGTGSLTGSNFTIADPGNIYDGAWHFLSISLVFGQPSSARWFVDGQTVTGGWTFWGGGAGGGTEPAPTNTYPLMIGGQQSGSPARVKGSLDQIRIYRRALVESELLAIQQEGCTADLDNDGWCDELDNCPLSSNPGQSDTDHDGAGDACDPDFVVVQTLDTASIFSLVQADIDGDNYVDFVFTGSRPGDSLSIAFGKTDGTLSDSRGYLVFPQAAVAVGFINGDTLLDILAHSTSQTKVLLNQGGRLFNVTTLPFREPPFPDRKVSAVTIPAISAGYFNNDDDLDFIATPNIVAFGNGTGGFPSQTTLPSVVTSLGAADLNADFSDDVVAVVGDSVKLFLNNGAASFNRSASTALAGTCDIATILSGSDLTHDGKVDCVVITGKQDSLSRPSLFSIIVGDGGGGILAKDTFSVTGLVRSATLSDIDRDKNLDLSAINSGNNRLLVMLGDGQGEFPDSLSAALTSSRPLDALASGDLNRDGNPDFVSGGDSAAIVLVNNELPPLPVRPEEMVVTGYNGYDLSVINPLEYIISRQSQTVAGAAWWQVDINNDNVRDVRTYDYNLLDGEYRFVIRPTPLVPPGSAFTMDIRVNGSHQIKAFLNLDISAVMQKASQKPDVAGNSLSFYYTVESTPSMSPSNGERTKTTRQPAFIWSKLVDSTAVGFQFQLDDDYDFDSPVRDTLLVFPRYVYPTPLDTGKVYYWRARTTTGSWSRTMAAYIGTGCCIGYTGNVNKSASENPDLSDLSLLIAYLVQTPRPTLSCTAEANVNASVAPAPDLSDLSLLIAYLTQTPRPALPTCP